VRLALKFVMQNEGIFVGCNATVQVYHLSITLPIGWKVFHKGFSDRIVKFWPLSITDVKNAGPLRPYKAFVLTACFLCSSHLRC
jgi:hypothetical protein